MENEENKARFDECQIAQESADTKHDRGILEEIKLLNQEMLDPKHDTFKKTTYWHQQSSAAGNINTEALLKDIIGQLVKIEAKLTQIEILLDK